MHRTLYTRTTLLLALLVVYFAGVYSGSVWYHYVPWHLCITRAIAVIQPTQGNSTAGTVTFTQGQDGVHVSVTCHNLTPGKHGFHIHEHGDCSCSNGMCTGDHFNPTHTRHGGPDSSERHVGDFGNLEADTSGTARLEFVDTHISLNGPHTIIGRAIIIHADPDDLTSQPSGNAGARIGCGVIGIK